MSLDLRFISRELGATQAAWGTLCVRRKTAGLQASLSHSLVCFIPILSSGVVEGKMQITERRIRALRVFRGAQEPYICREEIAGGL